MIIFQKKIKNKILKLDIRGKNLDLGKIRILFTSIDKSWNKIPVIESFPFFLIIKDS